MHDREDGPASRRILAIANQKGGVGKTTTAINLGTALAAVGRKTVIVDLDPQGNASTGLGVGVRQRRFSTYDVLTGASDIANALVQTAIPGLSVLPGSVELSGFDIELVDAPDRAFRLKAALDVHDDGTQHVLIDCPPALNLLTLNAMTAADAILVPLQCEFFALEGLSQLLKTVEKVKKSLNPRLTIEGIILTMFDKRNNLSGEVATDVRATLGDLVFETAVPRNVRLSEAPSHALPAIIYDHACAGSQAYLRLAGELLRRDADTRTAA